MPDPIRIVQLSDLHLTTDPAELVMGTRTRDPVGRVLQRVRRDYADAAAFVLTGDLAHDEQAPTYRLLRDMLGDLVPRCLLLPGNHDLRGALREAFSDRIGGEAAEPIGFSHAVGHWRLLGLDSHIPGQDSGRLWPQQLEWLAGELAAHRDEPTLVFVHHPPLSIGTPWLDEIRLFDAQPLVELLAESPAVAALCTGHVHAALELQAGPVRVITCPSAATQMQLDSPAPRLSADPPAFRVFTLDEGELHTEVVSVA